MGVAQRFILASDGLAHASSDAIGQAALLADAAEATGSLLTTTVAAGAPVNISVIMIDVGGAPSA